MACRHGVAAGTEARGKKSREGAGTQISQALLEGPGQGRAWWGTRPEELAETRWPLMLCEGAWILQSGSHRGISGMRVLWAYLRFTQVQPGQDA